MTRAEKLPQLLFLADLPRQQSRQSDLASLQSSVMAEIIASTSSALPLMLKKHPLRAGRRALVPGDPHSEAEAALSSCGPPLPQSHPPPYADPHAPVVMEFLGTGTGTQGWFLRGGEIMWIYVDFLSDSENTVCEFSEWLKPKSPSESLCVAVMGKEEERKGCSWGRVGGRV